MMVKVLLYAYCIGVPSSRKIAKRLEEDIAFRVPAANNTPDFRTISDFRKDHLDALAGLFLQVLKLCQRAGLVKLGHIALDGIKMKANASKHKTMSYKRMKEEENRLEAEVRELLRTHRCPSSAWDQASCHGTAHSKPRACATCQSATLGSLINVSRKASMSFWPKSRRRRFPW